MSTLRNVRAATGAMPDMERPLPGLGEHYIKQWKREADAKLVRTPSKPRLPDTLPSAAAEPVPRETRVLSGEMVGVCAGAG